MTYLQKLFFALMTFYLVSCKVIAPVSPEIKVGVYTPHKQEVSIMTIPIEMEMKSYFSDADEAVPYEFKGNEQKCEDVSYSYKFIRNPIKIEGNPKKSDPLEVGIEIDGKYALNLNYCPKCSGLFSNEPLCLTPRIYASCGVGESMRKIKVEYTTTIALKPNFNLDSKTKLKAVTPKDKCEVTVFSYDATSDLIKEVKGALKDLSKEIDKEIEALAIRKEVETIWNSFTVPFDLAGYGFLYVNPERISVNNLRLDGTKLKFETVVESYPKVNLIKETKVEKPLPNLSNSKNGNGFNINLDLHANYDSLSAILNREMSGKTITIKRNKITFQKAKIYGAANKQLSIEVEFSGSKTGKLFFLGTPVFNDSLQEISFPDLSFELQTKNALLKSAKWIFNDKITKTIRSYATFNMIKILSESKIKIEEQLNQKMEPNIYLSGKIDDVRVKTIFPDQQNLIIQSNLKGTLNVLIK